MEKGRVVCHCENCGNEADMIIKCELVKDPESPTAQPKEKKTQVCSVCGNEADMTVEGE